MHDRAVLVAGRLDKGGLQAILDSVACGVILQDSGNGAFVVNRAACEINGFPGCEEAEAIFGTLTGKPAGYRVLDRDGREVPFEEWPVSKAARREPFSEEELTIIHEERKLQWTGRFTGMRVEDENGDTGWFATTLRDVTEQRMVERELLALDQRKDGFLAALAHEMRTPLNAIATSLHLLREEPESSSGALDILERQTAQLTQLVNDLLDHERIAHGEIHLRRALVDVAEVIAAAENAVAPLLAAKRHRLHVSVRPESLQVRADRVRLEQILVNLLSNAAKYTGDGGDIFVTATLADGEAQIEVRDNGIGIPARMLPRVFDFFTPAARRGVGTGIGLSVVKQLVERHGGTIRAESDGEGAGSRFVICLPA